MVEKILNNTTPYGKIRASHEGSLHYSTLSHFVSRPRFIKYYNIIKWCKIINTLWAFFKISNHKITQ